MKQSTLLTKIVMVVLFVAIAAYIIGAAIYYALNPFKTEVALWGVHDDHVTINAWVFRDEVQLPAATGLINLRLDEGDKIAAGKSLAAVYQSQEALSRQQELREIDSQITQLAYAISDGSLSGSTLESEVTSQLSQLHMAASSGEYSNLAEQADTYKKLILRREFLSSEEASAVISQTQGTLLENKTAMGNTAVGEYSEITSPAAGYYSAHTDGFESLLLPSALDQITTSGFQGLIQQTPPAPDPASLGKVVTSTRWKLAFLIESEKADRFRAGNEVEVRLSSLTNTIEMTVDRVSLPEEDQCVVVLTSDENLQSVLSMRNMSCVVVFSSKSGISIPKEALRVLDDLTGVYTVTGYRAEFKPVSVLAEGTDANGKEYYIVEPNPQSEKDERILRSGDEVILAATDLYVGKVVR